MKNIAAFTVAAALAGAMAASQAHADNQSGYFVLGSDIFEQITYEEEPLYLSGKDNSMAAEGPPPSPFGALFRGLFGDRLEKKYGISVHGWVQGSLAFANHDPGDTLTPSGFGESILPQGFFSQQEGGALNQAALVVCSGDACAPMFPFKPEHNVLGRVTPTPAPRSENFDVNFNVTMIYGEDAFFLKTKGLDDWSSDADNRNKFTIPQAYLDFYIPFAGGMNLMVGSFQTPLENEIGYPATPPNWFMSHTYAFAHGPAKHVGALTQIKIPTSPGFGHLGLEAGIVLPWNSAEFSDTNEDPSFIGSIRWRSPNMKTWIDIETIYGNGENDSTDVTIVDGIPRPNGGGSPYLALSSTGEYLDRFAGYLNITHQATDRLQFALEATYGFQEGGDIGFTGVPGSPPPWVITEDTEWYGVNVGVRYKLRDNLFAAGRAEWFYDETGAHVLWGSVGATGGDVYSLTANLYWTPMPWLTVRPEIRYDWYDGDGNLFAPSGALGLATEDDQFLTSFDAIVRF